MASHLNGYEVAGKLGRRACGVGMENGCETWRAGDAARFLFKGQCYDAGPASDTMCSLCGERIQLCYVVKVLEAMDLLSPEIGKLNVGECCFKSIDVVNEKLYRQLLAAAVNLRTYIEAIQRDQRIFRHRQEALTSERVKLPRLEVRGPEKSSVRESFEALVNDGGDHA